MKKREKEVLNKSIERLTNVILEKLDVIEQKLANKGEYEKFYRNRDLKEIFGLSANTIIKYRQSGHLPFTKLGDIFLYDPKQVNQILRNNQL